jgi:hypothetical protein
VRFSVSSCLRFDFARPRRDPPAEREEILDSPASDVPPVDLTIQFATGDDADRFFGDSQAVADLMGLVAGAHATHAVGGYPQVNSTPEEVPG